MPNHANHYRTTLRYDVWNVTRRSNPSRFTFATRNDALAFADNLAASTGDKFEVYSYIATSF